MNKLIFIASLLLLSTTLPAQIQTQLLQGRTADVDPGQVATLPLRVTNTGADTLQLMPRLNLPSGWRTVAQGTAMDPLLPFSEKLMLITVIPPSNAEAGNYRIPGQIIDQQRNEALSNEVFFLTVAEKVQLDIPLVEGPHQVLADQSFPVTFLVHNGGNTAQQIALQATNGELTGPANRTLLPGAREKIQVEVSSRPDLTEQSLLTVRLTARVSGQSTGAHAYHHVDVYPVRQDKSITGPKLHTVAELSYLGRTATSEAYQGGIQGNLMVQGALDEAGDHRVALQVRAPDQFDAAFLGQFSAYSLQYEGPKWSVNLGDQSFGLTPLTEFARLARGLQIGRRFGNMQVSGFYVQPRFFDQVDHQMGGSVRFEEGNDQYLQVSVLHKDLAQDGGQAQLISTSGRTPLASHTEIEAEISASRDPEGNWGQAASVRLASRPLDNLDLNGQVLAAGAQFAGYYENTLTANARVNYRPLRRLHLSASLRKDARNMAQDTLLGTAPATDQQQVQARWHPGRKQMIAALFRRRESEDLLPTPRFHTQSTTTQLRWQLRPDRWHLLVEGEYGYSTNLLLPDESNANRIYRLAFNGQWQPWPFLQFGAQAQWSNQDFYLLDGEQQWLWGLQVRGNLPTGTDISLMVQNDYTLGEYYRDRDLLRLDLTQQIGPRHQLMLSGNYGLFRGTLNDRNLIFRASYRYEMNVPLQKQPRRYSIRGQLSGLDPDQRQGIVVYLNGQAGITDREGRFSFAQVSPGEYQLLIDRSQLDVNYIPNVPLPLSISVDSVQQPFVHIPMIKGASLNGRIFLEKKTLKGTTETRKLGSAFIEIRKGEEVHRQLVGETGDFSFSNLRPGEWLITIIHPELGKKLFLSQSDLRVQLKPGSQETLQIPLREKERTIQFMGFSARHRQSSTATSEDSKERREEP